MIVITLRRWLLHSALPATFIVSLSFAPDGFAAKAPESVSDSPAASNAAAVIPRSVFDYRAGRDPFFPNRVVKPVATAAAATLPKLFLKGVTGSAERRVALINDRTFTKGESGEVKLGTNTFKFRVIDIKEKSVTLECEGSAGPKELPLVENLLPLDGRK